MTLWGRVGQEVVEVGGKVGGVGCGAADGGRFPPAQEWQSHDVNSQRRSHAAIVLQLSLAIEDRQFQLRIIGTVTGRPDDGADGAVRKIEFKHWGLVKFGLRQALGIAEFAVASCVRCPGIECVEQAGKLEIGQSAAKRSRKPEGCSQR